MSNSPLVSYTKISPNKTSPRTHEIDTITIHCVVGQCSAERLGAIFTPTSKQASCNYGIGYDGRIALIVEEKDRSWCSSSSSNDNRAITIEVASDTTHPYAVNDAAYKSLINLLVDICQRNNIKELKWKADKSLIGQPDKQNMTVHRWFANKACPGEYLYSRHGQIAAEVNARLNGEVVKEPVKVETPQTNSYPIIRSGSTGEYVKKAQERLNKHNASLVVDGIFGDATLAAVKKFQKENNLDVDGIVGPKTWAALTAISDEEPKKEDTSGYRKIVSNATATVEQMVAHIKAKNPNVAQSVIDMIPLYLSEGKTEGIAGDIAFAQSCIETGNFAFRSSAVTLDQNNFCGMGVTSNGMKGNSFATPQLGIRAQIQHLKAYASIEELVNECVDPRFHLVRRGCAEYVEWLGIQANPIGKGWAAGKDYGKNILRVLNEILSIKVEPEVAPSKPTEANSYPIIRSGSTGSYVKKAQEYLNKCGASLNVDGAFGNLTLAAVKKFQKEHNLDVDGIVGPKTWAALDTAVNKTENTGNSYKVKVEIDNLNIRKGPGVNYAKTGSFTGRGVFTIVEVSEGSGSNTGWGRLKSGAGWISLDFAKRV